MSYLVLYNDKQAQYGDADAYSEFNTEDEALNSIIERMKSTGYEIPTLDQYRLLVISKELALIPVQTVLTIKTA